MTRSVERRLAILVVGGAIVFTIAVVLVRAMDAELSLIPDLPPVPQLDGLEAFWILPWFGLFARMAVAAALFGVVVRWVTGWRGAPAWIATALPIFVCLGAAVLHAPFLFMVSWRMDRVLGWTTVAMPDVRGLAAMVLATFALAVAFLVVTRMRRTPAMARTGALTVPAVLGAVLLHLYWIQLVFPMADEWRPSDYTRRDLLIAFRPCRGAILWDDPNLFAGRIDDMWLHFADPRKAGATTWAMSARGEWRQVYYWFDRAEAERFKVRIDDPAVIHCNSIPRRETVAPASWHRIGVDW